MKVGESKNKILVEKIINKKGVNKKYFEINILNILISEIIDFIFFLLKNRCLSRWTKVKLYIL